MIAEWLGINGFRFYYKDKVILLDPWVTRDNHKVCDKDTVARYIPCADYIFIGHSHWDHLADAAEIHRQTGAVIIGSETTINICRSQGVKESYLRQFHPNEEIDFGCFKLNVFSSLHKKPMLYPGEYKNVPAEIKSIEDFLEGGTFALLFNFEGIRVLNIGSANFSKKNLTGVKCDYLLAGIAGYSESYYRDIVDFFSPKTIIPTHFDYFETPLEENKICIDVKEFREKIRHVSIDIEVIIPTPLEMITLD